MSENKEAADVFMSTMETIRDYRNQEENIRIKRDALVNKAFHIEEIEGFLSTMEGRGVPGTWYLYAPDSLAFFNLGCSYTNMSAGVEPTGEARIEECISAEVLYFQLQQNTVEELFLREGLLGFLVLIICERMGFKL